MGGIESSLGSLGRKIPQTNWGFVQQDFQQINGRCDAACWLFIENQVTKNGKWDLNNRQIENC